MTGDVFEEEIRELKSIREIDDEFLEDLLIEVYRFLDTDNDRTFSQCISVICHVASLITLDADQMVKQLLHDCITKSRIFLYDNLLQKDVSSYQPFISAQDLVLQNFYTSNTTGTTLTKPQKEIFDEFQGNRRLVVSAPTSFGKTRIIREIISHNNYQNIALIMPTVSLLSELYQDLRNSNEGYILSKSSKVKISEEKNYILVLTPERMGAFLQENPNFKIDFFVMDEIYKVDYKLDDDRFRVFTDILYRLAKTDADFYLIGPYISDFSVKFRELFGVKLKRYDLEIVQKDFYSLDNIENKGSHDVESGRIRVIGDKFKNLLRLVSEESIDGKFLIYRYQKRYVEESAKKFIDTWPIKPHNKDLIEYLSQTISAGWDLISCIKRGVGFHHGAMPRHIQDLIVDEFNDTTNLGIDYLFCTTSLTEGINSAAKNVILYDAKIGNGESLKTLDRKNIEGRAGRFMQHFIGRVFYLDLPDFSDDETVVEVDFLDSSAPSIESLMQLDVGDIPSQTIDVYENLLRELNEKGIPDTIISENKFVRVDGQINLIEHLRNIENIERYLFEGQLPPSNCLDDILSTVYDYLFTDHDIGRNFDNEVGKSILIGLTKYYVYYSPSFKLLLQSDTVQRARTSENARIRYVFDLMSKYFEFIWPKYLMSFENIYNLVSSERSQGNIDLSMIIAKLEYGTTKSHEIILRDSGLPNEIVRKISNYFTECESFDDVQNTSKLSRERIARQVHPIEMRILDRYI